MNMDSQDIPVTISQVIDSPLICLPLDPMTSAADTHHLGSLALQDLSCAGGGIPEAR